MLYKYNKNSKINQVVQTKKYNNKIEQFTLSGDRYKRAKGMMYTR